MYTTDLKALTTRLHVTKRFSHLFWKLAHFHQANYYTKGRGILLNKVFAWLMSATLSTILVTSQQKKI